MASLAELGEIAKAYTPKPHFPGTTGSFTGLVGERALRDAIARRPWAAKEWHKQANAKARKGKLVSSTLDRGRAGMALATGESPHGAPLTKIGRIRVRYDQYEREAGRGNKFTRAITLR